MPLDRGEAARPSPAGRRARGLGRGVDRRRRCGGDDQGRRGLHRPRARARARRRDRRGTVRQRLEGDQHRGVTPRRGELRRRRGGGARRPLQGRRLPRLAAAARRAARHGRVDRRIGPLIREAFGSAVALYEAEDMSSAVRRAFASASPGQTVVLAPACSSFDMFRDYAERGRVFKQEVRKLQEEWSTTREQ